ncbi:hypothetical protein FS837_008043, partial [Tulasnella sp. UAMH 9824]
MSSMAPNPRSQDGRQPTQPDSPFSLGGSSNRSNAYGGQGPGEPMATYPLAQGETPDNAQSLSGDPTTDGVRGAPSNPSLQARPAKSNLPKDFRANLQKMLDERPQDIQQHAGGDLYTPDNENFYGNIVPKYFRRSIKGTRWVPRAAPRQNDPTAQQTEPTTTTPVAAIRTPSPLPQSFLEAKIYERQTWQKILQYWLYSNQIELNGLIARYVQQFGRSPAEPVFAESGPSQPMPDPGPRVAHNPPQTNQSDGHAYLDIQNESPLNSRTDAHGSEDLQEFQFDPETVPPHHPVCAPTSTAMQPAIHQSSDHGLGADYGIAQAQAQPCPDRQTIPGGLLPEVWLQEDDPAAIPQVAGP